MDRAVGCGCGCFLGGGGDYSASCIAAKSVTGAGKDLRKTVVLSTLSTGVSVFPGFAAFSLICIFTAALCGKRGTSSAGEKISCKYKVSRVKLRHCPTPRSGLPCAISMPMSASMEATDQGAVYSAKDTPLNAHNCRRG
uniref:HDC17554 n=1 Tax=Drosophila melanogaster TaxID=7227 RepID=Q6IIN0_DROME|nr:TPA_inf: HDC17554 [Drosophila melanogaster]